MPADCADGVDPDVVFAAPANHGFERVHRRGLPVGVLTELVTSEHEPIAIVKRRVEAGLQLGERHVVGVDRGDLREVAVERSIRQSVVERAPHGKAVRNEGDQARSASTAAHEGLAAWIRERCGNDAEELVNLPVGVVEVGGEVGHGEIFERVAATPPMVGAARMTHRVVADLVAGRDRINPACVFLGDSVGEHEEGGEHSEAIEHWNSRLHLRRAGVVEREAQRGRLAFGPRVATGRRSASGPKHVAQMLSHIGRYANGCRFRSPRRSRGQRGIESLSETPEFFAHHYDAHHYYAHASATVEPGAHIGPGTSVWNHAHVRTGAVVGAECTLGQNAFVDRDVQVGDRVKIQNNASIHAGVNLADEVFVGPGAVFTNDRYPRAVSPDWVALPTTVGRGASIGANATVIGGNDIGEYAMVGAGSVVTHPVEAHELVVGSPAEHAGWVCRCGQVVSRDGPRPASLTCEGCSS